MSWHLFACRSRLMGVLVMFALLVGVAGLRGNGIETPADLKVGDILPGPLGVYYERGGEYLNVRIVENRFRVYFVGEDKETLVKPAFREAIIHYGNAVRRGSNRNTTLLELAAGHPYLTAQRLIPPPHRYWVQVVVPERAAPPPPPGFPVDPDAQPSQTEESFPMEMLNQLVGPSQEENVEE